MTPSEVAAENAVELKIKDGIAVVTLNRPDVANAFNATIILQVKEALSKANKDPSARAIVLRGKGRHFSAGADLAWMKASTQLSERENEKEAQNLGQMFDMLATGLPVVALVHGSAFGGAVGLAAAADISIATESARFCLSEVKVGLFPAVILPHLMRKMHMGHLRRFALSGRLFSAKEAAEAGLVQRIVADADLERAGLEELNALLQGAPGAQRNLKELMHQVMLQNLSAPELTASSIARARIGKEAQAGLSAFFDKKPSPWAKTLPDDFAL